MYITLDDLKDLLSEEELIQLSDDNNTGAVDEEIVNRAIEDASSEIDAYLTAKMDVPLSYVPQIIKKLCVDIAVYNLFSRRLQDEMSENIRIRYQDAIKLLKMIAEGKLEITGGVGVKAKGYVKKGGRVFSRVTMKGF